MADLEASDIFELLAGRAGHPLTLKDIQNTFDLSAGERKKLGEMLKGMAREGLLVQLKGGRFSLPAKVNLAVGTLEVHRDGYGFVAVAGGKSPDIFVPARHVRPAMHGDRVVVRLERSLRSGRPEGRIIRVEQRAHRTVVGRFESGQGLDYVVPADPRLQEDLLIPAGAGAGARPGQIVVAEIDSYPGHSRGAVGHVLEVLGDATDPAVEIRIATIRFNLPSEFSPAALAEAAQVPQSVEESDLTGREDLRHLDFVTIDGETARDFDDAVAIARRGDGYRLWVAIADVAHYVPVGSAIDSEALERGTSVYFPGSCLPMLPEALSNGICSLNPEADRLVMAAELDFDVDGRRVAMRFLAGVIRSRARLTYTEVAAILVERDAVTRTKRQSLVADLEVMQELAELRMARRRERGSLDFDLPETLIQLDLRGRPENILRAERNLAHRLIEEFMLAANEAVAVWIGSRKEPLVYRIHQAPSAEKMIALQEFIAYFNQGIAIPSEGVTPKLLQALLDSVAGRAEEAVINHVVLRSLPQAIYATTNLQHFGLAAEDYCHFTSPIRRYPDLTVHRILKRCLAEGGKSAWRSPIPLEQIASQSSFAERRAMEAERDIVNLKKCQFMSAKVGETFSGLVTSVQAFGFFVELQDFFVEGLVHVSSLNDDFYQYEEERHRLIGSNRRREFAIGTPVSVRVHKVDLERREIDFRLVDLDPGSSRRRQGAAVAREPSRQARQRK